MTYDIEKIIGNCEAEGRPWGLEAAALIRHLSEQLVALKVARPEEADTKRAGLIKEGARLQGEMIESAKRDAADAER